MPAENELLVALEPQTVNLAEAGMSLEVQLTFEASSPEFAIPTSCPPSI